MPGSTFWLLGALQEGYHRHVEVSANLVRDPRELEWLPFKSRQEYKLKHSK